MLRGISASSTSCRFHCPTNCTNSGSLVLGAQIVHSNGNDGKLALSLKKTNKQTNTNKFSLSLLFCLLIIEPIFTPHRAHIDPSPIYPSSTLHRSLMDPTYIDPTSSFRFKTIYLWWYQPWIVKLYTTTRFLMFTLQDHHHISIVFPHQHHHNHHHIWIVFPVRHYHHVSIVFRPRPPLHYNYDRRSPSPSSLLKHPINRRDRRVLH